MPKCKIERDSITDEVINIKTESPRRDLIVQYMSQQLGQEVVMDRSLMSQRLQELGYDNILPEVSVWHGSPHSFDRFEFSDRTFLTGEKAAAFGAGLYFTELESIARNYAHTLTRDKEIIKVESPAGEFIIGSTSLGTAVHEIKELLHRGVKPSEIADIIETNYSTDNITIRGKINILRNSDVKITLPLIEGNRNLYRTSLHKGRTPDQYTWLEWDRPLSDSVVQKIFIDDYMFNGEDGIYGEMLHHFTSASTPETDLEFEDAQDLIDHIKFQKYTGEEIYQLLSGYRTPKEASMLLLSVGVDGIKYPAESISRGATSDTARAFNYVVFDENAITIEEHIQFLSTPQGEVYGFVDPQGTIYLDPVKADETTLLHEGSHIEYKVLKALAPKDSVANAVLQKAREITAPIVDRILASKQGTTSSKTEGDFQIFTEEFANPEQLSSLEKAKSLQQQGLNNQQIWLATGWEYDNNQNKWISELETNLTISNPNNLNTQGTYKITEIINYPEFFEKFPQAQEIDVIVENSNNSGTIAYYNGRNTIYYSIEAFRQASGSNDESLYGQLSNETLFEHELHHAGAEYMSLEGGASSFGIAFTLQRIREGNPIFGRRTTRIEQIANEELGEQWITEATDEQLINLADSIYWNAVGEVTARNVQRRSTFSPEERRSAPPSQTQDTNTPYNVDFQIIGEQGASNLNIGDALLFNQMEAELGLTNKDWKTNTKQREKFLVKQSTGFERGTDGKLRHEITPIQLKTKQVEVNTEYNMSDVLDAPELFEAYPEIQKTKIEFSNEQRDTRIGARYEPGRDKIILYTNEVFIASLSDIFSGSSSTDTNVGNVGQERRYQSITLTERHRRDITHELSHRIATIEGFNRGGSPNAILIEARRLSQIGTEDTTPERQVRRMQEAMGQDSVSENDKRILRAGISFLVQKDMFFADQEYLNLSGEVEARNNETRLDLTTEERQSLLLELTEDTPRDIQIEFSMELSSPVYNQRQNETEEQYRERIEEEVFARLIGDNASEYLDSLGFTKEEAKTFLDRIREFLQQFKTWLQGKRGFQNMTIEEISQMSIKEFLDVATTSQLLGEFRGFENLAEATLLNGEIVDTTSANIVTYPSETGDINYIVQEDGSLEQLKTLRLFKPITDSLTFPTLLSIPNITPEEASDIYAGAYEESVVLNWESDDLSMYPEIRNPETGELLPFYKNYDGDIFDNYVDAIKSTETGDSLHIFYINTPDTATVYSAKEFNKSKATFTKFGGKYKLLDPKATIERGVLPISFNKGEQHGQLNTLLNNNLLQESGSNTVYDSFGYGETTQQMNRESVQTSLLANSGRVGWRRKSDTFEITEDFGKMQFGNRLVTEQEIEDSIDEFRDPDTMRARQIIQQREAQNEKTTIQPTPTNDTNDSLVSVLTSFLNSIGVSIETIESYKTKYAQKHGISPDATALSDMANQVIAFKNGEITLDDLAEETSHFIVEGWNQNEIERVLANIHKTQEYAENAQAYREAYTDFYLEEQLENVVRREVLGKYMANSIKNDFNASERTPIEQSIFQRILQRIRDFFDNILNKKDELKDLTSRVNVLLKNENLKDYMNEQQFISSTLSPMYALSKKSKFYSVYNNASKLLETLEKKVDDLQRQSWSASSIPQKLNTVRQSLDSLETFESYDFTNPKDLQEIRKKGEALNKDLTDSFFKISNPTQDQWNTYLRSLDNTNALRTVTSVSALFGLMDTKRMELQTQIDNLPEEAKLKTYESQIFQFLQKEALPMLESVSRAVDKNKTLFGSAYKPLRGSMDAFFNEFRNLSGDVADRSNNFEEGTGAIIDETFSYSEEARKKARNLMTRSKRDTTWFFKLFGQLMDSPIPQVAVVGKLFHDMSAKVNEAVLSLSLPILPKLQKHLSAINAMARGRFLQSSFKLNEVQEQIERIRAEEIKDILGLPESVEELVKKGVSPDSIKTLIQEKELPQNSVEIIQIYRNRVRRRIAEDIEGNSERNHRELRKFKIYDELGTSVQTIDVLNGFSADTYKIKGQMVDNENPLNPLNRSLEKGLRNVKADRAKAKSIYNDDRSIKQGLTEAESTDPSAIRIAEGVYYTLSPNPSIEARIAYDIHRLDGYDNARREQAIKLQEQGKSYKNTGWELQNGVWVDTDPRFPEGNLEMMKTDLLAIYDRLIAEGQTKEQASKTAFQYLLRKSNISFTQEYWDSFDSPLQTLLDELDVRTLPEIQGLLEGQRILKSQLSLILKENQENFDYKEVDASTLTLVEKETIIDLQQRIKEQDQRILETLQLQGYIEDAELTFANMDMSERKPNMSFYGLFKDTSVKGNDYKNADFTEKVLFLKENISPEAQESYRLFDIVLNRHLSGKKELNDVWTSVVNRIGIPLNNDNKNAILEQYLLSKLPIYFQRSAPIGYDQFVQNIQQDFVPNFEALLNGEIENTEIKANLSYQEDTSTRYKQGWETYREKMSNLEQERDTLTQAQYLHRKFEAFLSLNGKDVSSYKPKYIDQSFLQEYGMSIDTDGYFTEPTKKLDQFDAYLTLLDIRAKSLENNNELTRSIFSRYMGRQTNLERFTNISKTGNVRTAMSNMMEDWYKYREEEEENFMESDIRVIPKMGFANIPLEDASNDILKTYILDLQASELYKQRTQTIEQVNAIQTELRDTNIQSRKAWNETNAYQMLENAKDAQIFGRKVTYRADFTIPGTSLKIDGSKVLETFKKFVTLNGLGFGGFVALTSLTTAGTNKFIQRFVKYHIYDKSANKANIEFSKLMAGSAADVGRLVATNKLDVLMQYFGNYNMTERLTNSTFGFAGRNLDMTKTAFSVHQMANFPVIPRVMLEKLFQYRVINGKVMSWSNFLEREKVLNPSKSKAEIAREFDTFENQAIYNYLDVENGQLWNKKVLVGVLTNSEGQKMSGKELDEVLGKTFNKIAFDVQQNISYFDGIISDSQRTEIQRHSLLSFLSIYRGWLTIMSSRMFSPTRINFATGNIEQGIAATVFGTASNILKDSRREGLIQSGRLHYNQLTPAQRANFKTFGMSLATIGSMIIATAGLLRWADDEDEKENYLLQASSYLALRTLNETFTSNLVGISNEYFNAAQTPLNAIQTIRSLINVLDVTTIGQQTKEGDNKYLNNLYKASFLKNFGNSFDTEKIIKTRKGYVFFNQQDAIISPFSIADLLNSDEENTK